MLVLLRKKQMVFLYFMLIPFALSGKTGKDIIKENGFKSYVEPLLKTKWAQYGGGENAFLPYVYAFRRLAGRAGRHPRS